MSEDAVRRLGELLTGTEADQLAELYREGLTLTQALQAVLHRPKARNDRHSFNSGVATPAPAICGGGASSSKVDGSTGGATASLSPLVAAPSGLARPAGGGGALMTSADFDPK